MAELDILLEIRNYYVLQISNAVEELLKDNPPRRYLGFANDNIFESFWEEYCVQIQLEEGDYFEVYEKQVEAFALQRINELPVVFQKLFLYIGRLNFQKSQIYESEDQVLAYSNQYNCKEIKKMIERKAKKFRNPNINKYEDLDLPNEEDE